MYMNFFWYSSLLISITSDSFVILRIYLTRPSRCSQKKEKQVACTRFLSQSRVCVIFCSSFLWKPPTVGLVASSDRYRVVARWSLTRRNSRVFFPDMQKLSANDGWMEPVSNGFNEAKDIPFNFPSFFLYLFLCVPWPATL